MPRVVRNRSLTLVLLALFAASWAGQCAAGLAQYNEDLQRWGERPTSLPAYLTSGHFWQATAENWESEFLQMGMFVVLTIFLYQKGSPESKDPDKAGEPCDDSPKDHRGDPRAPWPVRRGGWVGRLYASSLSLAFFTLFAASFALHAVKGAQIDNEERVHQGHPPESVWQYATGSRFWFESMQNWQSEFLSIAAMVFLSVYLRQKHSPESKPVHAAHSDSGEE